MFISEEYVTIQNRKVYHLVTGNIKTIKKYGLCSPRRMYEVDKNLFMKTSYSIYQKRAADYKNISINDVTAEDILYYLDNSPQRVPQFSSRSLFFSYLPLSEHHNDLQKYFSNAIELSLPMKFLEMYYSKPVIVGPGPPAIVSNWNIIKDPKFMETVKKAARRKPHPVLRFKYIPHLAVDAYHIPFNKFEVI